MLTQMFEGLRKATESSMQAQQEIVRQMTKQWMTTPHVAGGMPADLGRGAQRRWIEIAVDGMNRHRESLDTTYKAGIDLLQRSSKLSDSRSADEYQRGMQELWEKMFDTLKTQVDGQVRDLHDLMEHSFDAARHAQG